MKLLPFHYLLGIMLLFDLLMLASPFIARAGGEPAELVFDFGHFLCHQRDSRSYCFGEDNVPVECVTNPKPFDNSVNNFVNDNGQQKAKFFVCSRDIGIYLGMLFGILLFAKLKPIDSKDILDIRILILAIVPIGIDGTIQLISELGFAFPIIGLYESTNLIRLLTGLIAGLAVGYAMVPIANSFLIKVVREKEKKDEQAAVKDEKQEQKTVDANEEKTTGSG